MTFRKISLALIAVGLATLVGLFSFVIGRESRSPAQAYAVGMGPKGIAQANLAYELWLARLVRDPAATINAHERKMAERAIRAEPLSISAMAIVAVSTTQPAKRQHLLELAGRMTRRNSLINQKLIVSAASRDDQRTVFAWLSRSILTDDRVRGVYVDAMAELTGREGAVSALASVIGPAPEWADYYWRTVVRRPQSLVNAAILRMRTAQAPWRQTEIAPPDRDLSLALVKAGEFATARDLSRVLSSGENRGQPAAELLSNAHFSRQPLVPPFDWQLAASGNLGSTIDPRNRRLTISAIAGATGMAARQLVSLEPGRYVLSSSMTSASPLAPNILSARVECAEGRQGREISRIVVPLVAGEHEQPIVVSNTSCRWHWLSIDVNVGDGSVGFDVSFEYVSLKPSTV